MRLIKIAIAAILFFSVASTTVFADTVKGQKLFIKKLKKPCGMNGAKFAVKHSQNEWKTIYDAGKFEDEIIKLCPKVEKGLIKNTWFVHIYEFSYEYANDSGNVPSC